ncbi:hypothetical protein [Melittangium boletus]|uniref:hypothetical protein n=1 Tax=Melittangium boletus TaxID=83453 RepID=UPI003DA67682
MHVAQTLLWLSLAGQPSAPQTEPLCVNRAPCALLNVLPAGQDARGVSLSVKHLSLGWMETEAGTRFVGQKFTASGRQEHKAPGKAQCEVREWWLQQEGKADQLLLSLCGDGQGAVREETASAGANHFIYSQSGVRRNAPWSIDRSIQLSPLLPASTIQRTQRISRTTKKEKSEGETWEFDKMSGEVVRAPSDCRSGTESSTERLLPYLPKLQVDAAYLGGGWKQTGFRRGEGECHLVARTYLQGEDKVRDAQDASLRVLLVPDNALMLEVLDEKVTGPSANWHDDDHLEIWLGEQPPQDLSDCGPPTDDQAPKQWLIRLADAKVFPGFGAPEQALRVERAPLPGKEGYRLKVQLPPGLFRGISVVYNDSDGGKGTDSRIATSALTPGRPETLNPVYFIRPEQASCSVRDGLLTAVRTEIKAMPDQAVLQMQ